MVFSIVTRSILHTCKFFTILKCLIAMLQVLVKESFVGLEDVIRNLPGENFTKIRAKSMKGENK